MSDIKNEKFRSVSDQVEVYKFRIETLEQIELFQRNEITSLITTIESQKECNRYWKSDAKRLDELNVMKQGLIDHQSKQIQSQKEEIEKLLGEQKENENIIKRKLKIKQDAVDKTMTEIESLKAITELAVKGLKELLESFIKLKNHGMSKRESDETIEIANEDLSEIERLQNG